MSEIIKWKIGKILNSQNDFLWKYESTLVAESLSGKIKYISFGAVDKSQSLAKEKAISEMIERATWFNLYLKSKVSSIEIPSIDGINTLIFKEDIIDTKGWAATLIHNELGSVIGMGRHYDLKSAENNAIAELHLLLKALKGLDRRGLPSKDNLTYKIAQTYLEIARMDGLKILFDELVSIKNLPIIIKTEFINIRTFDVTEFIPLCFQHLNRKVYFSKLV
jgi:hypothetical protein